jgi:hypothetical protein
VADDVAASVHRAPRYIAERQDLSQCLADAEAVRRVAAWREARATEMRDADDPLTIMNFRGDPLVRGVQITTDGLGDHRFRKHNPWPTFITATNRLSP